MHIKYKPKSFDEVIGNNHIKKALQGMKISSPIMLEGIRGSGKTSIAHIIAREFGAPSELVEDRNCVHFSGVKEMREKIEELSQTSILGKKRVLILDEIHRLSDTAQEVLLKPLESEEFIGRVLILACTTTTEKVKGTLLDRFTRFKTHLLTTNESRVLIERVLAGEQKSLPKWVKHLLIESSEGIPRRILTNIPKLWNVESEEEARYLLEVTSLDEVDKDILDFMKCIMSSREWKVISSMLISLLKKKSPEAIRMGLINLVGGRLTSSYFSGSKSEGERLVTLSKLLRDANFIPPRAALITVLYEYTIRR